MILIVSHSYLSNYRPVNLVIRDGTFYCLTAVTSFPYFTGHPGSDVTHAEPNSFWQNSKSLTSNSLQGGKSMVQRTKIRSVIRVILSGLFPLLVTACGSSVAVQSERDKTAQQTSDVTMLIGAQQLPPPPPPAPPHPPP